MERTVLKAVSVSEDFWSYFLYRKLHLFRGPRDPKTMVSYFIEEQTAMREEDAKTRGVAASEELIERARTKFLGLINDYITLMLRIGEFAHDRASTEFAEEELKIVQVRTDFDFRTWLVRMLFVIDAQPHKILVFRELLGQIEKAVLLEGRFVAQLFSVNKRDLDIDFELMRLNYPFVGKLSRKD